MTILYVDDDSDDRDIFLEAILAINKTYVCFSCRDGLEALSFLSEGNVPDIIFLDINMPLMDGKACLMEIKTNKDTSHIPVIMCTTSNNPDERMECENLGASDFFLKPVSYSEMKEIIGSILVKKI